VSHSTGSTRKSVWAEAVRSPCRTCLRAYIESRAPALPRATVCSQRFQYPSVEVRVLYLGRSVREKRRSDEVSYRLWIRFTLSRCSLGGCTVFSETAKRLVRKVLLAGVQEFVVQQQVQPELEPRRAGPRGGPRYTSQDAGHTPVKTVFGPVQVPHPRGNRCTCQQDGPQTFVRWGMGSQRAPLRSYASPDFSSHVRVEVGAWLKEGFPAAKVKNDIHSRNVYYAETSASSPRASQRGDRMSFCGAKAMLRPPHWAGEVFQAMIEVYQTAPPVSRAASTRANKAA
jgi:hypothetical protein